MQKNDFSRYNDGMAYIYREKERQTDFSAKRNVKTIDDMDFIMKLAFEECSKREQDLTFAEQNGFTLSMKIKTRYVKNVDNKCKAVIDGYLYDISYTDKSRTELFIYMEGVRELAASNN